MADGKTMHEIAELLRVPAEDTQPDPQPEDTLDEGNPVDDETLEEDGQDDTDFDDSQDDDDADGGEYDTDEDETDEVDDEDDTDDQRADDEYVDVTDDDMIEVKIDGEVVLRSIAEAKKALSGEGAIDKRLKEATEARKTAQADHTLLLEQFSVAHKNLVNTISGLEDVVFKPVVQKPDASLRASNKDAYLDQMDAYEADQKRIQNGKAAIRKLVQEQNEGFQKDVETYKQQQTQMLVSALPELTDQEKGPRLLQQMQSVAMDVYGFSPEELSQASDHRMYRMMHDLALFHSARGKQDRKTNTVKNLKGQQSKRPRTLRSGATGNKAKARKNAKQQQAKTEAARQTGKVKDIAKTILTRK